MKSIELEIQLDKAGLNGSVAGLAIAWLFNAANTVLDSPWGYASALTTIAALTFWLFH
ncbi:MAG: hypothetical protein M0Z50_00950 [Planctomycetia bacterium]|nr:hypothetical protein [Planctomycetia bacterium]